MIIAKYFDIGLRCSSGNKLQHPINQCVGKIHQKNFTFSFRKIFGCAISFGLGKVKTKETKI